MNQTRPRPRLIRATLRLTFTAVALLTLIARPADAHDKKGKVDVVQIDTTTPLSADVTLRITYVNDGHGAKDAVATIVAENGTASVGPITLIASSEPGRYTAHVVFPNAGSWLLRASSLEPATYIEQRVDIVAAPTTTHTQLPITSTTLAIASSTNADVPADTAAASAETSTVPAQAEPNKPASTTSEKKRDLVRLFAIPAVIVLLGALSVPLLIVRRRSKART